LATRASSQLVVDSTRFVPLRAQHVEPAQLANLVAFGLADWLVLREGDLVSRVVFLSTRLEPASERFTVGETLGVATEDDVNTTTSHVRRHRHGVQSTRLGDNLGFTEVLLGVQDLVGHTSLVQLAREELGFLDRGGTQEHRLTLLATLADLFDDRLELGGFGLIDQVRLVETDVGSMRRDRYHGQRVGTTELTRLRLGRTGHASQLLVEPEVVLQGHGRPGVVLLLDAHALFRLDRLVQTVGPTSPVKGATREFIDDLHDAAVDEVVLVAVKEFLGPQRLTELVDVVVATAS